MRAGWLGGRYRSVNPGPRTPAPPMPNMSSCPTPNVWRKRPGMNGSCVGVDGGARPPGSGEPPSELVKPEAFSRNFDLCQEGLRHPESGEPVKRRLEVITSRKIHPLPLCQGRNGYCSSGSGRSRHRAVDSLFLKGGAKWPVPPLGTAKAIETLAVRVSQMSHDLLSLELDSGARATKDRDESTALEVSADT